MFLFCTVHVKKEPWVYQSFLRCYILLEKKRILCIFFLQMFADKLHLSSYISCEILSIVSFCTLLLPIYAPYVCCLRFVFK